MSAKVKGTMEDCHVAAKLGRRGKYVPNSSWMVRMERISSQAVHSQARDTHACAAVTWKLDSEKTIPPASYSVRQENAYRR